jgi:serine/threonine protein kinase
MDDVPSKLHQLIHCDIKPANKLLDNNKYVLLRYLGSNHVVVSATQ